MHEEWVSQRMGLSDRLCCKLGTGGFRAFSKVVPSSESQHVVSASYRTLGPACALPNAPCPQLAHRPLPPRLPIPRAVRTAGRVTVNGAKFSKHAKRRVGFVLQVIWVSWVLGGQYVGSGLRTGPNAWVVARRRAVSAERSQAREGGGSPGLCLQYPACMRCATLHPCCLLSLPPSCRPPPHPPCTLLQDDLLYETLTVTETLNYAAALRLPRGMTAAQRRERVEDVISALGLGKCKDTIIGGCWRRVGLVGRG